MLDRLASFIALPPTPRSPGPVRPHADWALILPAAAALLPRARCGDQVHRRCLPARPSSAASRRPRASAAAARQRRCKSLARDRCAVSPSQVTAEAGRRGGGAEGAAGHPDGDLVATGQASGEGDDGRPCVCVWSSRSLALRAVLGRAGAALPRPVTLPPCCASGSADEKGAGRGRKGKKGGTRG